MADLRCIASRKGGFVNVDAVCGESHVRFTAHGLQAAAVAGSTSGALIRLLQVEDAAVEGGRGGDAAGRREQHRLSRDWRT